MTDKDFRAALLGDRGIIKIAGEDARHFLDGLFTADIDKVAPGKPRYAALLTPQGKIIADFIVVEASEEDGGGFYLDCPRALVQTLMTRLGMYKLRAKATIEDMSDRLGVLAIWNGGRESEYGLSFVDPRYAELGWRIVLPPQHASDAAAELGTSLIDAADYEAHRIALTIPRGGVDFIYNDAFPHEADIDQLGGVDFDKGCYVGQEVVSRMQHRGGARTRIVGVMLDDFAPEAGVAVMAGDKQIGTMGSAKNGRGLAMLRLDRLTDALATGTPIMSGGLRLRPFKPAWAKFEFPETATAAE